MVWGSLGARTVSKPLESPKQFEAPRFPKAPLLGGSWVVISGVISPRIWVIRIVTLSKTHL